MRDENGHLKFDKVLARFWIFKSPLKRFRESGGEEVPTDDEEITETDQEKLSKYLRSDLGDCSDPEYRQELHPDVHLPKPKYHRHQTWRHEWGENVIECRAQVLYKSRFVSKEPRFRPIVHTYCVYLVRDSRAPGEDCKVLAALRQAIASSEARGCVVIISPPQPTRKPHPPTLCNWKWQEIRKNTRPLSALLATIWTHEKDTNKVWNGTKLEIHKFCVPSSIVSWTGCSIGCLTKDAMDLSTFKDESFDVVFDKSTLDALKCLGNEATSSISAQPSPSSKTVAVASKNGGHYCLDQPVVKTNCLSKGWFFVSGTWLLPKKKESHCWKNCENMFRTIWHEIFEGTNGLPFVSMVHPRHVLGSASGVEERWCFWSQLPRWCNLKAKFSFEQTPIWSEVYLCISLNPPEDAQPAIDALIKQIGTLLWLTQRTTGGLNFRCQGHPLWVTLHHLASSNCVSWPWGA